MSSEVFEMISIIAFVLAGILLVFSIFWWFKFGIWGIIGDLSGRTAKKSIAQMRADNEKNANFSLKSLSKPKQDKESGELITIKKVNHDNDSAIKKEEIDLQENATTVLKEEGTTVLEKGRVEVFPQTERLGKFEKTVIPLEIIQNIVLIHTEEKI